VIDAEVRYVEGERWLLAAVWQHRRNISPDDAPYVALSGDVPLVTLDERLGRAARAVGARVLVPR
jgi:predicted nucleic acid-binding protein